MSDTRDKRRRTDLDLFVLALIDSGVATPYELHKDANLSPGATIPALARLLQTGMVRQGKPGIRGRVEYRVTRAGSKNLATGWRNLIEDGPTGDLDADLRVALLALWIGGDRRAARDFLNHAASASLEALATKEQNQQPTPSTSLAEWYRELRSASAIVLLKGESDAARAMAKALSAVHVRKRIVEQPK